MPFVWPSTVAVSGILQRWSVGLFEGATSNAHSIVGSPCFTELKALNWKSGVIIVAIFTCDGAGVGVGDGLVTVALGDGDAAELDVRLMLEVVVLADVEAFSVRLAGATLL